MPKPNNQSCANCLFYQPEEPVQIGQSSDCRAHPPQVALIPVMEQALAGVQRQGMQLLTYWPKTNRDHWCGEWQGAITFEGGRVPSLEGRGSARNDSEGSR